MALERETAAPLLLIARYDFAMGAGHPQREKVHSSENKGGANPYGLGGFRPFRHPKIT